MEHSRRRESPPLTTGHPSFDAAEDVVGLLGCECMLLDNIQLSSTSSLKSSAEIISKSVFTSRIPLAQVQHSTLGLVELHEVLVGLLQLVQVALDGIPSFCCVN